MDEFHQTLWFLVDKVFIKGLSNSTFRIKAPLCFLNWAYCFLDKKLYPNGSHIDKALAQACL